MERKAKPDVTRGDEFVNYMPAMPNVSGERSRLRSFVGGLFRRDD